MSGFVELTIVDSVKSLISDLPHSRSSLQLFSLPRLASMAAISREILS